MQTEPPKAAEPAPAPEAIIAAPGSESLPVSKVGDETTATATVSGEGPSSPEDQKALAIRQVEFYFADSNLPFDKFMWTLHTANAEYWVPIATVASFKRMREFKDMGVDWVARALREGSKELEVDEAGTNVRRRTEVKEPKGQFDRSVYAKGFGQEDPALQRKLEQFFEKYGKVNAVRMRRKDGTKEFKGSVFTEFAEFSSVDAFLKADPKPSWEGTPLIIMSKGEYVDMKIKEKGLTGKAAHARRDDASSRKGFNAFREMRLAKEGGAKGSKEKDKLKKEVMMSFMGSEIPVQEEEGGSVKDEDVPIVKGATLKFAGCGGEASFDDIKKPLKERFTRSPFVKYNRGDDAGLVGFDKMLSEEDIAFSKKSVPLNSSGPTRPQSRGLNTRTRGVRGVGADVVVMRVGAGADAVEDAVEDADVVEDGVGGDREKDESGAQEETGEKRKRAVEPDGGHDAGVRGQGVPVIASTSAPTAKKAKVDAEAS
ncbi:hypothetical protein EW146_g527 [Bondarzewia mesenterica]|uniref:HTH La-type RNA-binding domain-containing protein n=1 Tax=Bondarzewia mesenterica TaxID=1095465 RepID=A0A4S4M8N8_9AGAM|nr:hypothetical protein EW146_g527 [Bondarzewia mesenterica]